MGWWGKPPDGAGGIAQDGGLDADSGRTLSHHRGRSAALNRPAGLPVALLLQDVLASLSRRDDTLKENGC